MQTPTACTVYGQRPASVRARERAQARKWTEEMLKDPEKCRQFLIKYGFITKSGKLAKRYGG